MRNFTGIRPKQLNRGDAPHVSRQIAGIARVLNECLLMLDDLGQDQAAAHLSTAIMHLPGQEAAAPFFVLDLVD